MTDVSRLEPGHAADATVRGLVIPLERSALLVPHAMVSEVASLGDIEPVHAVEEPWLLGSIAWRGLRIPLVSYELLLGVSFDSPARGSRAIVFNTLNGDARLPFVAILSQGIPRLVAITQDTVQARGEPAGDAVLSCVDMRGEEAYIPDLDFLEQRLRTLGITVENID